MWYVVQKALSERWQLEAWLIFSPLSVCLRALNACVIYVQLCSWRLIVHISLWTLSDLHIDYSESPTTASLLSASRSIWPRAKMANLPAVHLQKLPQMSGLSLSDTDADKFCRCCSFISSQTFCQSVLEVRHQAEICWSRSARRRQRRCPGRESYREQSCRGRKQFIQSDPSCSSSRNEDKVPKTALWHWRNALVLLLSGHCNL